MPIAETSRFPATPEAAARGHRLVEWGALLGAAWLAGWLALRLGAAVRDAGDALLLLAAALAGLLAADFVSGLVHWWADRVADAKTPWLGPGFIRPFREHHDDPLGIVRHGFAETNGNNCAVVLPLLVAALAIPLGTGRAALFAGGLALGLAVFSALTNQIHKWAHQPRAPRPVRWLQRAGLILEPRAHALHHAAPHDCHYCITTGWLNPLLDRAGLFAAFERALGPAASGRRQAP